MKARNTVTSALLNSSRLVDVDGSTVVINFSSDLLRDKMADEQNTRMVCSVMSKYFGQDVRLICTTGEHNALPKSSANSGMQQVEEAIKKLGGKLREIPTDYSVKDE